MRAIQQQFTLASLGDNPKHKQDEHDTHTKSQPLLFPSFVALCAGRATNIGHERDSERRDPMTDAGITTHPSTALLCSSAFGLPLDSSSASTTKAATEPQHHHRRHTKHTWYRRSPLSVSVELPRLLRLDPRPCDRPPALAAAPGGTETRGWCRTIPGLRPHGYLSSFVPNTLSGMIE